MNLIDTKKLIALMGMYYSNWRPGVNEELMAQAWQADLEPYNAADINAAFRIYRAQGNQFPPAQPMVLVALLDSAADNSMIEGQAWDMVYKAICNSSYGSEEQFAKLPEAVQKAVGSPGQLRQWAMDENFNANVVQSNFLRSYRTVIERQKNEALFPQEVLARIKENDVRRINEKV